MKKNLFLLCLSLILVLSQNLLAETLTRQGTINAFSLEIRQINISVEVNGRKLGILSYDLGMDFHQIKVWANNKRIYLGLLQKGMKINYQTNAGKLTSITVTDSQGINLYPNY